MNNRTVTAGYLPPGLALGEVHWHTLSFGQGPSGLDVQVPALTPLQARAVATHVREAARQSLRTWPVSRIIATLDRVVARLLDPADPWHARLLQSLPGVSGFDPETTRLALTSYLQTFRGPQLHRFVAQDFANPKMLDEFQPAPAGGWARALGPQLLVHVWAGNVPGLSLWSLVCGLLVKAGTVGKVSSAEPLFASWFAQLLAEEEPDLADGLAVVWWKGGDEALEQALLPQADVVVAYGGNETLDELRQRVPVTTRFLPHGHKLSLGVVSAAALQVQTAQATARWGALDVARYDQQGCYSPQVFYVERGGPVSPQEFAHQLAGELAALQHRFPRRTLTLQEATSVSAWRQSLELASLRGTPLQILGTPDSPWVVAFSDTAFPLQASALQRTVLVCAVDSTAAVARLVEAQKDYLQTVGLAVAPHEMLPLAESLGQAGATRLCALGEMTAPEAGWHHDGRFSLLDLVTMVGIDASTEQLAETLAPYRP